MFEVAELGNRIDKGTYNAALPELRIALLQAQQALREANFPVFVLVSGVNGAGKGDTVNTLNEWMDPRWLQAFSFGPLTDEERERPEYWRFWRALTPKGRIGLYVGSWYSQPIAARVEDEINDAELDAALIRIRTFERALVDDGALVIKFWLHLSPERQKKRLKQLAANPDTAWQVTDQVRRHLKDYDKFRSIAEHTLRATSMGEAPWIIVDGSDHRYRNLTVARHILDRIQKRLARQALIAPEPAALDAAPVVNHARTILDALDLEQQLDKKQYKQQLTEQQTRLRRLARRAHERQISCIVVLEGWDAAGKGGIIRRIVPALDARSYQIIPIAAPTDEERGHHYLWRFWRHIPRAGYTTLYDRSWYGRVLVERVEGFAGREEWMRAYAEINDFERQLTEHGIVLLKFWLHIDADEQLRRFQEREQIPWKQHKITEEDYRNRERAEDYVHAVNDMVERTSTEYAPWHLIEGNDKRFARVKAIRLLADALAQALGDEVSGRDEPIHSDQVAEDKVSAKRKG